MLVANYFVQSATVKGSLKWLVQEQFVKEQREVKDVGPSLMNAFELISLSQGLNLSALFDRRQVYCFYMKN